MTIVDSANKFLTKLKLRWLSRMFRKLDYLDAYATRTDLVVSIDPELAIGGLWDEMGQRQFEFLKQHGMEPHHKMLDIGCGTLRGGIHCIEYLESGHYFGMDISRNAISYGKNLVESKGLNEKRPSLSVSAKKDLKFAQYAGQSFDYILAQSVFSHLRPEDISECFEHIGNIMTEKAKFFFTFHPGTSFRQRGEINFEYPHSFFEGLAQKYRFELEDVSDAYKHPRDQRMFICVRSD